MKSVKYPIQMLCLSSIAAQYRSVWITSNTSRKVNNISMMMWAKAINFTHQIFADEAKVIRESIKK